MKKIWVLIIILVSIALPQDTTAVDTIWQKELVSSLSFSQTQFDNWAAGGENTFANQFDLGGKLIHNSEKYVWTNTGKIAFGNSKIGEAESKKTIDEIRIESLLTYLWDFIANPYVALKGETQLAPGYEYGDTKVQVSNFLDPGYFTQSVGLQYSPMEEFSIRIGAAIKETITKDFPIPFADDLDTYEIEKTKVEPGVESVLAFSKKINDNTIINSSIDMFNNFKGFDATDVRWDTDITTQIVKYMNLKFSFKLFYDRDISTKRQLNQSFLLGLTYTFL